MQTRKITRITEENVYEIARRPEIVALFTPLLQYGADPRDPNGGPVPWQAAERAVWKWGAKVENGFAQSKQWWRSREVENELARRFEADRQNGTDTYHEFLTENDGNIEMLVRFQRDLYYVCVNRYFGHPDGSRYFETEYDAARLPAAQAWLAEFPMRVYSPAELAALEQADIRIRTLTRTLRDLYMAAASQSARLPEALEGAWSLLEEETGEQVPEPGEIGLVTV